MCVCGWGEMEVGVGVAGAGVGDPTHSKISALSEQPISVERSGLWYLEETVA